MDPFLTHNLNVLVTFLLSVNKEQKIRAAEAGSNGLPALPLVSPLVFSQERGISVGIGDDFSTLGHVTMG
jgi:hypothetical protein